MALMDYQKLCPKSGHALTNDERTALDAGERTPGRQRTLRCGTCGRTVEICVHPGTGQSLIYSMHVRDAAESAAARGEPSR
jgi:transcription elongation factor Elf1